MDEVRKDKIVQIEIDELGKFHVKPDFEKFTLIYRTATQVHWDKNKQTLYSPIPKDWDYLEWYKHIIKVAKTECFVELNISEKTIWLNIPDGLKKEITKA